MSEPIKDYFTYDSLAPVTRKERTALLGLSMLGLAIVKVPLVPEKIAFLGIEFGKVSQATFVNLYGVVIAYYILAFYLYALNDYIAWLRNEALAREVFLRERRGQLSAFADADDMENLGPRFTKRLFALVATRMRVVFDMVLPLAFGGFSAGVLFAYGLGICATCK